MDARLTYKSVEVLVAELRRKAEEGRPAAEARRLRAAPPRVTIRFASPHDAPALDRLAQLESTAPPAGSALVAELEGNLVAALPLDGSKPLADPFRRTADAIRLLELRAEQLKAGGRGHLPRGRLHPRPADR